MLVCTNGQAYFLLYPSIAASVFSVFKCREIHERYWLDEDLSIECHTGNWTDTWSVIIAF